MYYTFNSIQNSLLIAMPKLNDSYFAESVILVCEHNENGAMGLVINRPLDTTIASVLLQMKIKHNLPELNHIPVLSGGPVKTEKGFIITFHDENENSVDQWDSSLVLNEHISITTSNDILLEIANGSCPEPYMMALGYCEWSSGQLEEEIKNNSWLCTPLDLDIMFNVPYFQRWRECTYNIGINEIHNLCNYYGHA